MGARPDTRYDPYANPRVIISERRREGVNPENGGRIVGSVLNAARRIAA